MASGISEQEYDLLTAALIGLAVGAGITLLLHHLPGENGRLERIGRGGDELVERAGRHGRRMRRDAKRRMDGARDALRHAVEREVVRGVRRAVLRQRRRLGL
jgi:hypothetical protein